jgi:hypothetical protein
MTVSNKLANRLAFLPLILAGPILRRVTDSSVTVWVAIQGSADVTLSIRQGDPDAGSQIAEGMAPTVAVGQNLHIVAVTVPVKLVPGVVYTYDMFFDRHDDSVIQTSLTKAVVPTTFTSGMSPAPVTNPVSYPPYDLPSFSLPPATQNDLRIIHGSCRMPHGNGPDALSILDDLIRVTVQNAVERPHQLLLTGDQIYADDVAAVLLAQIMDASNTLLGIDPKATTGWQGEETLPSFGSSAAPFKPSDCPPLCREDLLGRAGAGFTSADLRSHLMSLGEYLCMYLFTWSDVLWPTTPLPAVSDLVAAAKAAMDIGDFDPRDDDRRSRLANDGTAAVGDLADVIVFQKTLPKVRRALANIPTYMICDDHDVTDDWNMTIGFCNAVYASANGLGRRIVQNALVAYALCQLWGNTPEQFQFDASNKPAAGRQLLSALDKTTSTGYDSASASLQTIVGIHTAETMKARTPESAFHDQKTWLTIGGQQISADSLVYNFVYTGPAHQIVFTDTRSWRSYAYGDNATADLLPPDQIAAQIPLVPDLGDRALFLVVTTNAPPVQPIRGVTRHDTLTTWVSARFKGDPHPDLYESWELPSLSLDRLLKRVTDKLKPDTWDDHYGQCLILSGDVHHSFATRLVYRATNRYGDTQAQSANVVFAQLVASSFKKQDDDTVGFQRDGYFYVPQFLGNALIFKDMSEGYVGWNVAPGAAPYKVGSQNFSTPISRYSKDIRDITNDAPTIQIYPMSARTDAINLTRKPDYRYRFDYLEPSAQSIDFRVAVPIGPAPGPGATPSQRAAALQTFNAATANYRAHNQNAGTQKVIGRNNIGEITLDWGARDNTGDHKQVNHTVRWRMIPAFPGNSTPDPDFTGTYVVWTTYTVSLDPGDQAFKDYTATVEPP